MIPSHVSGRFGVWAAVDTQCWLSSSAAYVGLFGVCARLDTMQALKTSVKQTLARLGIGIHNLRGKYSQDGLLTVHSASFRQEDRFRSAYARGIRASNGVDPGFEWRVHIALWAAEASLRVEGDFVECGVNAGFISSAIMQWLDWNRLGRRFYLVDTFDGPVLEQYSVAEARMFRLAIAARAKDVGAYVTDMTRIRANFAEWPSAVIIQGTVPDVLHTLNFERVAFLHLDMNCALPERTALEFFWDRLSPGAAVLFDDYSYVGHDCQREAIDSVARRFHTPVLVLPTGQGLLIR